MAKIELHTLILWDVIEYCYLAIIIYSVIKGLVVFYSIKDDKQQKPLLMKKK